MIIISLFLVMCSFKEKSFSNGDVFIGKLNGKGKMTGRGVIIWPSGSKYEGELFSMNCWKDGSIYTGIMKWANGNAYDGCWSNGLKHVFGVYRSAR
jgi:1-phosphatidylinositol-4-phosphate 5-kinase